MAFWAAYTELINEVVITSCFITIAPLTKISNPDLFQKTSPAITVLKLKIASKIADQQ